VVIGDRSVHNTEVGFAHTPRVHADRVHRTFFTAAFSFHRGRFSDLIIRSRGGGIAATEFWTGYEGWDLQEIDGRSCLRKRTVFCVYDIEPECIMTLLP